MSLFVASFLFFENNHHTLKYKTKLSATRYIKISHNTHIAFDPEFDGVRNTVEGSKKNRASAIAMVELTRYKFKSFSIGNDAMYITIVVDPHGTSG